MTHTLTTKGYRRAFLLLTCLGLLGMCITLKTNEVVVYLVFACQFGFGALVLLHDAVVKIVIGAFSISRPSFKASNSDVATIV